MKKISPVKAIVILLIIGVTGFSFIYLASQKNKETLEYTTQKAEKINLVQTVTETGVIKSSKIIDLSFEQGGKIEKINVSVGQNIKAGETLAELDHSSLDIRFSQAKASLDIAKANLAKLLAGATREELAIYQANYNRAKTAYDASVVDLNKYKITLGENIAQAQKTLNDLEDSGPNTKTALEQSLDSAKTNFDNSQINYQKDIDNQVSMGLINAEAQSSSINNSLDQINSIINNSDFEDFLSVKNRQFLTNTKNAYNEAIILLAEINKNIISVKKSPNKDNLKEHLGLVLNTLNKTYISLTNCFSALENSVTSSTFSKTQVDTLKTIINSQIGIISSSISSIQSSIQGLDSAVLAYNTKMDSAQDNLSQAKANLDNAILSAKNNLTNTINTGNQQIAMLEAKIDSANKSLQISQAELNRIKSGARAEDTNLYQAQVRQAESELNSINNQIEKSQLKSSVPGTVSRLNFEQGELYTIGKPIITIITDNNFEIDVDVSESDINKVKIDNPVTITIDALSRDLKFPGKVSFIEPAETVIQEVIYYKVKIVFDSQNGNMEMVKPGMTADVEIITNKKDNVIAVPGRAIIDRNGDGRIVRTYNNNVLEEKKVELGIMGDAGLVEIISGIEEGDEIVTFVREK